MSVPSRRSVLAGVAAVAAVSVIGVQEVRAAPSRPFVLVHGAWHTGRELEETASFLRAAGHSVHTPTLKGNQSGDSKRTGLQEAIQSIVEYLAKNDLKDVILVGHSYGGMIITGVADEVPERLHRLVYWNAFVPNNGESLLDMLPPESVAFFESIATQRSDGGIVLPFPVWRELFINDADLATAEKSFNLLNPQPYATFKDKIKLKKNPAEMQIGKSYINATEDTALPHQMPWHPRLSQKLGLFRLVQVRGSHELCFSNPKLLAQAILAAGRD
ncbi:alpha/beta hydrolase [Bradyrhizobium sp. KB893862 SZCCT0404]|uniref:alpha/beta hydrolase n=1 Tax=Bradyrhizobium sp. KB893862 SZCCT0404 TaxID=2807672 RepID=UPI001BA6F02E|nr:alpha/beta hydrolase [Bradyrhizobium sp. KB893862 SZCCT0404]MBR1176994.1 alpha/beta hydrolase [Bradyrhizobium sp. KB893862 SZCCT0404]